MGPGAWPAEGGPAGALGPPKWMLLEGRRSNQAPLDGGSAPGGPRPGARRASPARRVSACAPAERAPRRPRAQGREREVCFPARTYELLRGCGCEGRAQVSARAAPCDPVRHGVASSRGGGGCGGSGSAAGWAGPAAAHEQPGPLGAPQERRAGRGRERGGKETTGREGREGEAKEGEGKSGSGARRKRKRGGREAGAARGEGGCGAGSRGGSEGRPGGGRRGRRKRGGRDEEARRGR